METGLNPSAGRAYDPSLLHRSFRLLPGKVRLAATLFAHNSGNLNYDDLL